MGCCCSGEASSSGLDTRHPLLRDDSVGNSQLGNIVVSSNVSSTADNRSQVNSEAFGSLEYRARLDAIRGPPVIVTMSRSDRNVVGDIVRGSLKAFMKAEYFHLPPDIPLGVWLNIHLKDFIEHMRVFNKYLIRESCQGRKICKTMCGPPGVDYLWNCDKDGFFDDDVNKKISAATYIERVIETSSRLLKAFASNVHGDDSDGESEERKDDLARKTIVRLIFRVYCHILYHHHDLFVESHTLPHLNNCFTWFILFSTEFNLLDPNETQPLQILIDHIVQTSNLDHLREDDGTGFQLSVSYDRLSTFIQQSGSVSYSDNVSHLTASSFGTERTIISSIY